MNIKNWISDFKYNLEHSKNAKRLNSELEKRYYKPKSNSIIKILSEIDKKAGLSSFDIIPYLIKIKLMPPRYSMAEEGSGGTVTDRKRNDELFKELEELGFIRILENKLYSDHRGVISPTSVEDCILRVKLLPKGVDYLREHNRNKFNKNISIFSILISLFAFFMSLSVLDNPTSENYDKLEKKVDSIAKILDNSTNYEKK